VDYQQTSIWSQGWKDAQALNLEEHFTVPWNDYIQALKISHIRINDQEDELLWQLSPFGVYSPKEGYSFLMTILQQQVPEWWWKGIWKVKCPLKARLFMWCLLRKRVPTWDRMKSRGLEGSGWCPLCKGDEETSLHLFLGCPFSIQTWRLSQLFWVKIATGTGFPLKKHGSIGFRTIGTKTSRHFPFSFYGEYGFLEM
jgi:hypothetical protein